MSTDQAADFFEVGDKTSLICADSNIAEAAKTTLREMGFKFHTAEASELAIERIRHIPYDCIIIQENFDGSSLRSNSVLSYVTPLPMASRRNSFFCLIGPSFNTLDAMQAFAHSVHLVMNPADLPNLTAIMKKGLAEFEMLYRIYRNTVASLG